MPSSDPIPDVYVREPGSIPAIQGVPTAVTALVGRTLRGPAGRPVPISGFAEFDRVFGGLAADFPLAYAAWDFFQNGGSQAVVVRLYAGDADAGTATLRLDPPEGGPGLTLRAAGPGDWANGALTATVRRTAAQLAGSFILEASWTRPDGSVLREHFADVSLIPDAGSRRLDRVLADRSALLRYVFPPDAPPFPEDGWTGTAAGGVASAYLADTDYLPPEGANSRRGIYALEGVDLFNLLCLPPDRRVGEEQGEAVPSAAAYPAAAAYCEARRAFLVVDPPPAWLDLLRQGEVERIDVADAGTYGLTGRNAAVYFPHLLQADPCRGGAAYPFAPSGAVAGIMARTDAETGVWKAPAGTTSGALRGVVGLDAELSDRDNGFLSRQGINCLRTFPLTGSVVWGARTLRSADVLDDDFTYISVRRLALYIEESLYRGTAWAALEPNAEPLWAALRQSVSVFMRGLAPAFFGSGVDQGYFVRCDA
ncbi:MAG TPA: phage tail sheath subtilisin-like domain-containing protein, partial [Longimicrobiaceae bacterium]|nr:phage tail sheath subtilisin-like domain-containing protein [Longimicrobiaceae bacterium]